MNLVLDFEEFRKKVEAIHQEIIVKAKQCADSWYEKTIRDFGWLYDRETPVEFFEKQRWGGVPNCPHCGSKNVYMMKNAETGERQRDCRWRCRSCKKQFTVRTGTCLENSKVSLDSWRRIVCDVESRGVGSARHIQRLAGTSYKTALSIKKRIFDDFPFSP